MIFAGLLAAGCAARQPVAPRAAPAVLPSATELEQALAARREALRSLRALARLRYRDPDGSGTSREAIVAARPDRVRVEILSVLGSVFVLTAQDGTMAAYAPQEDTVYRGQASPRNLARYVRIGLPVRDLVDLVLGTPPQRQARRALVSFDPEAGAVRLSRELTQGAQTVWFAEGMLPVAAEEHGASDQADWRATFAQYEQHGGLPVATRIGLELPAWSRSMDIALQDIDVNPALDYSIFALQTPPGSKVVNLDNRAD